MGNVLEKAKQEQVIALGRLGWSLRRIEAATGVRRETAGGYLRSAGIGLRAPGGWGRKAPAKAASTVTRDTVGEEAAKPAKQVITGFSPEFGSPLPTPISMAARYITSPVVTPRRPVNK